MGCENTATAVPGRHDVRILYFLCALSAACGQGSTPDEPARISALTQVVVPVYLSLDVYFPECRQPNTCALDSDLPNQQTDRNRQVRGSVLTAPGKYYASLDHEGKHKELTIKSVMLTSVLLPPATVRPLHVRNIRPELNLIAADGTPAYAVFSDLVCSAASDEPAVAVPVIGPDGVIVRGNVGGATTIRVFCNGINTSFPVEVSEVAAP